MVAEDQADRDAHALTEDDLAPLKMYIEDGIEPGGFLSAVLQNNLCEAAGRADLYNRRRLFEYVQWLYNDAPANCWGSPEKVQAYLERNNDETLE